MKDLSFILLTQSLYTLVLHQFWQEQDYDIKILSPDQILTDN